MYEVALRLTSHGLGLSLHDEASARNTQPSTTRQGRQRPEACLSDAGERQIERI